MIGDRDILHSRRIPSPFAGEQMRLLYYVHPLFCIDSNVLRSWKGDATTFTEAGFQLSERYPFTEDELRRQGASYPSLRCPVCGDLADGSN